MSTNLRQPLSYKPVRGRVYTAREIQDLDLLDSPFFLIPVGLFAPGSLQPFNPDFSSGYRTVQTQIHTVEEELAVPLFADTKWEYSHTTSEWIPIFHFVHNQEVKVSDFVDVWYDPSEDYFESDIIVLKGQVPPWPGLVKKT